MLQSRRVRAVISGGLCLMAAIGLAARFWPQPRFNLLLVTLDTTRADHIGCYGHSQALTPTLDTLAKNGVLFEKAYATVTMTLPSHATILTGLHPPEHGLHLNGKGRLGNQIPTLAEVLARNGYETGAFIAAFVLHSKFGLDRGFQTYDDDLAGGERFGDESHLMRNGRQMVDAALSWLTGRRQKPFFCWVHLYDPHAPFEGHAEEFGDRFRDAPYDGDIAFADQQVGRLIDFLKARGLAKRTIVVVVGDHGEGFGEHQEREHGFMVYNSTVHVPLIVSSPPNFKTGHRVSTPVSLVDVFPTVLDCMQVHYANRVSGKSLRGALQGAAIEPRLCYSEADSPFADFGWAPLQGLTSEAWKYVRTTREELYDLRADPHELQNLAESQSAQLAEMQRLLAGVKEQMVECPETAVQLTESDRRKLESLGYAAGRKTDRTPPPGEPLPDVKDMIMHYNAEVDARKLMNSGHAEEAAARLREVVKAAPEFMIPRLTLGAALQKQKLLDEAISVYEEALRIKPDCSEAHFDLAKLLAGQGKLDAAIEHYSAAVQSDPGLAMGHINLASLYMLTGDVERAGEHFERGLEEFPHSAIGHFNYGMFLASQGDAKGTLAHVDRAVKLNPGNAQMRYQLGYILISQGQFDKAVAQLEETLRLDPRHPRTAAQLERARNKLLPGQ